MKDFEIEKKFVIPDEETLERLKEEMWNRAIPELQIASVAGPLIRFDVYYDTPDDALLRRGLAFRMGLKSDRDARLTFKAPTDDPRVRREVEDWLTPEEAEAQLLGKEPSRVISALKKEIGEAKISPALRLAKLFWAAHGPGWECVFGHTLYAGPRGAMESFDLEVEAKDAGDLRLVENVGALLQQRYRLKEETRSKYQYGRETVG